MQFVCLSGLSCTSPYLRCSCQRQQCARHRHGELHRSGLDQPSMLNGNIVRNRSCTSLTLHHHPLATQQAKAAAQAWDKCCDVAARAVACEPASRADLGLPFLVAAPRPRRSAAIRAVHGMHGSLLHLKPPGLSPSPTCSRLLLCVCRPQLCTVVCQRAGEWGMAGQLCNRNGLGFRGMACMPMT